MKLSASIRNDQAEWRASTPNLCMSCENANVSWLDKRHGLQLHHIEGRRFKGANIRANYLKLCSACHADVFHSMPKPMQLAYKLLRDARHYDLQAWLRICDPELNAPDRVTQEEVSNEAESLRIDWGWPSESIEQALMVSEGVEL